MLQEDFSKIHLADGSSAASAIASLPEVKKTSLLASQIPIMCQLIAYWTGILNDQDVAAHRAKVVIVVQCLHDWYILMAADYCQGKGPPRMVGQLPSGADLLRAYDRDSFSPSICNLKFILSIYIKYDRLLV